LTISLVSTYAGLITAQLLNPIALRAIGWKYYVVFCCILAGLFVVLYLLLPETKGRSLEEIAEVFDGKSLTVSSDAILKTPDDGTTEQIETTKVDRPRHVEV
jgi:hypothetical protein